MRTTDDVSRALRRLRIGSVTLERAIASYCARPDLATNTRRRVRSLERGALRALLPLELDQLEAPVLAKWVTTLGPRGLNWQVSTQRTAWRDLRSVVRYAAERGWIERAPWAPWRPIFRSQDTARAARECCRSEAELEQLIETAHAHNPELACKIAVAAGFGLRRGELAGLRWSDWNSDHETLQIARQYSGGKLKTLSSVAVMRMPERVRELLREQLVRMQTLELVQEHGPIFPCRKLSSPGRARAYTTSSPIGILELRSAVRAAGLPHVEAWSAHSLRDTFVTLETAASGGDLAAASMRSRHASISSLVRYLRSATRQPTSLELSPSRDDVPRLPSPMQSPK